MHISPTNTKRAWIEEYKDKAVSTKYKTCH